MGTACPTPEIMEQLAELLGLPPFDILLVGDGSGSTIKDPCGWYAALYAKKIGCVEFFGGSSSGTTNQAELAPYVHAMWSVHTRVVGQDGRLSRKVRVVIVSDSELTCRCGNRQYERRANGAFWAALDWFEGVGYCFHWHHVPRNSNPVSDKADAVAGSARKAIVSIAL